MAQSNITMIKKLQMAINQKHDKIVYDTNQWYSPQQDRMVTVYHIKRIVHDEETDSNKYVELFKTTSTLQVVLFLRDLWYKHNGIDYPMDNEKWNSIRDTIQEFN